MKEQLINLLALLPIPHAQLAASTLKAVLSEVRRKDNPDADVADLEALVDEAAAEAAEPWRRIHATALAETNRL